MIRHLINIIMSLFSALAQEVFRGRLLRPALQWLWQVSVGLGNHSRESFWTWVTLINLKFQISVSAYVAYVSESPISQFILTLGVDIQIKKKKRTDLGAEHQASDTTFYLSCFSFFLMWYPKLQTKIILSFSFAFFKAKFLLASIQQCFGQSKGWE